MNNFTYCTPTRYLFGRGVEMETGKQISALGIIRALVVFGGGSAVKSGVLGRVLESLETASVKTVTLGGVQPNPLDDKVREGIALGREFGVDGIVAVGGGSVIDTAKAIAAGIPYDGDFWDFWAGKNVISKALPVGVVLTIPAAGSEGSGNSVITLREGMRKISLRTDYWLRPKVALMNPELTFTLPPYQTAAGIVDMMAHIMERYFSPTPEVEITDRVSEGVLMAIMEEGRKVMAHPDDYDARANIMWSGTLAHNGICGTGRVEDWTSHAMEHELSALYGVTHGAGLAVVFPAWLTFMARHSPAKPAQFARRVMKVDAAGSDMEVALQGIARLKDFFRSLGMPVTLAELGVPDPDIPELVRRLHDNKGAVIGGYYRLEAPQTTEIYRLML